MAPWDFGCTPGLPRHGAGAAEHWPGAAAVPVTTAESGAPLFFHVDKAASAEDAEKGFFWSVFIISSSA